MENSRNPWVTALQMGSSKEVGANHLQAIASGTSGSKGVDSGTASTRDSWRIMWRVLSARRKCRTGDSGTRPWASVYEILVHETSVFQAARGSDGVRVTPTREIEAPM